MADDTHSPPGCGAIITTAIFAIFFVNVVANTLAGNNQELHTSIFGIGIVAVILSPIFIWKILPMFVDYRATIRRNMEQKAQAEADKERQVTRLRHDVNQGISKLETVCEDATRAVDRAELEFRERAFGSFWDAMEEAANSLIIYRSGIRIILSDMDQCKQILDGVGKPRWEITCDKSLFNRMLHQGERMATIFRAAQKDYEFASIYAARECNNLRVAGFGNPAQALQEIVDLSRQLEQSM